MRLLNRPLAFILAVALAAASIILIIEVIAFATHASPALVPWPAWYHWAEATRWDRLVVRVWSAILIAIGVLLLALELKPRRITRLSLHSGYDATDAALTRSGLAGTLRGAAISIDGITSAAVTAGPGSRRSLLPAAAPPQARSKTPSPRQPAPVLKT
jgi:hypothetical protein